MNFTNGEGCFDEGDGLCKKLRRYSKVRFEECKGDVPPPSYEPESEEYAKWLKTQICIRCKDRWIDLEE